MKVVQAARSCTAIQARDVAVFIGHHYNSKVILGTATPSLETAYNVNKGKYGFFL